VSVFLLGATIVSWKVDNEEIIFVSKKTIWDGSKAVRGGIPICFPSFGPWIYGPQHGFARTSKEWKVHSEPKVDVNSGDVEVRKACAYKLVR
jgi:glucose-6-phosphate 1-epimerase